MKERIITELFVDGTAATLYVMGQAKNIVLLERYQRGMAKKVTFRCHGGETHLLFSGSFV